MRALIGVLGLVLAGSLGGTGCEVESRKARAPGALRVTDDAARSVEMPVPAQRIICFLPAVTDILLALGAGDRLIARTQFDTDPSIAHLPITGNALTPNLEWVASLQPDLVITWPDQPSHPVIARLTGLGIAAYAARTESIADIERTLANLGRLLGIESAATAAVTRLRASLDSVRASIAGKPRVRLLYAISIVPPTVAGPGTYTNQMIELAGGTNVFSDAHALWPQVSLEEILRRQPEAIAIVQEGTRSQVLSQLRNSPGWRDLRAVRAGRVFVGDPNLFNRPGAQLPRAAGELAAFLHAEPMR